MSEPSLEALRSTMKMMEEARGFFPTRPLFIHLYPPQLVAYDAQGWVEFPEDTSQHMILSVLYGRPIIYAVPGFTFPEKYRRWPS